jgi:formylglycine-generating enzyme required for sulfatase activity
MRVSAAILFSLMIGGLGYLLLAGGCSEETPSTEADQTPPTVAIVNPIEDNVSGAEIRDSVDVIIQAHDAGGLEKIVLFTILHADSIPQKLGEITQPDSSDHYSLHWRTAMYSNGSTGALYAIAYDRAGNQTASEKVRVLVINTSGVGPPRPDFLVIPGEGTVDTQFLFDASVTSDDLRGPIDILVRWDFDGNGLWDIDTTQNVKAATLNITHMYAVPDTYNVVLEAYNDYFSLQPGGRPGRIVKQLIVKPESGYPNPNPEEPFVQVPAGTYPLAALACPPGMTCGGTDEDETLDDTLFVRITNPYFIGKYEVTNKLYADYLTAALHADTLITYDRDTYEIRSLLNGRVLLIIDSELTRIKYQFSDSSFWADERYLRHPVTGVTWYGASAYAAYYGLRLPTEAEWEIAARGDLIKPGHIFPWQPPDTIAADYANYAYSEDPYEYAGMAGSATPVGAYNGGPMDGFATMDAVGPFGTYDQAGNAAEWVKDWYSDQAYSKLYTTFTTSGNPPLDPQGSATDTGDGRVVRGGSSATYPSTLLRVTDRVAMAPYEKAPWLGFRTAYIEF